ncbi:unnamed protein product [Gongylonema pulchrum]|uniref:RSN1_TM domain-containing protein n=1 Tax=Gongylonema pulchrum TaxID=637853 RepID=A0A183EJY2_9BILA|nr:unnamed protein product [Gongylonema pulchrum]
MVMNDALFLSSLIIIAVTVVVIFACEPVDDVLRIYSVELGYGNWLGSMFPSFDDAFLRQFVVGLFLAVLAIAEETISQKCHKLPICAVRKNCIKLARGYRIKYPLYGWIGHLQQRLEEAVVSAFGRRAWFF